MKPISQAVPGAITELLRQAPLSPGKVEFAWQAAVGPALQRVTTVRLEEGTLLVNAATRQWAREVSRSVHLILPRMRTLLGHDVVAGIRVSVAD